MKEGENLEKALDIVKIAAAVVITAALIVVSFTIFKRSTDVSISQEKALISMNDEYDKEDLSLLNGETVTASNVLSLVSKYQTKLRIRILSSEGLAYCDAGNLSVTFTNGKNIQAGKVKALSELTRKKLGGDTARYSVTLVDTLEEHTKSDGTKVKRGDGTIDTIEMMCIGSIDGVPTTSEEIKATVAEYLDCDDAWSSIVSALREAKQSAAYKAKLSLLAGLNASGSWDEVFTGINEQLSGATSGMASTVPYETITGISAGTSKTLSMSGDLNGIITNEDGNLIGTFTRTDTTTSVIPSTLGISFSSDGTIQNLSGSIVNVTAYQSLN